MISSLSAAVVAASAIAGEITAPQSLSAPQKVNGTVKANKPTGVATKAKVELAPGFPASMKGRASFFVLFLNLKFRVTSLSHVSRR